MKIHVLVVCGILASSMASSSSSGSASLSLESLSSTTRSLQDAEFLHCMNGQPDATGQIPAYSDYLRMPGNVMKHWEFSDFYTECFDKGYTHIGLACPAGHGFTLVCVNSFDTSYAIDNPNCMGLTGGNRGCDGP